MQHIAFVFIMPVVALYMFRLLFAPIIRSVWKLYMHILVLSCCKIQRLNNTFVNEGGWVGLNTTVVGSYLMDKR